MKKTKSSNITIKAIIWTGVVITAVALYMFLSIDIPVKPIAGRGDQSDSHIGGEFTLTDHNNEMFNSSQLHGQLSLIYFGFTYCPDICPTSLNKLTEVLNTLDKYGFKVNPVFVTIDPTRDTPEVLKTYLVNFHPKIIGLTGTIEDVKKVADLFKVYYAKSTGTGRNDEHYMIDHSSFIYLLDKNGKYLKHFYFNSTAEEIINYIRINK